MARTPDRVKYRARVASLIKNPPTLSGEAGSDSEVKAHWAKYVCVLVSGYIEQSVKEILLEHAESKSSPRIVSYVTRTWPSSKNMACTAISEILQHFDVDWQKSFDDWSSKDERKKEINEIISWRNNIAHGKESSTNNVTINSVGIKFNTACSLIDFLEGVVGK